MLDYSGIIGINYDVTIQNYINPVAQIMTIISKQRIIKGKSGLAGRNPIVRNTITGFSSVNR